MIAFPRRLIPDHLRQYFRPVRSWKPKDDICLPAMFVEAMRNDGWYVRSDIIWHKPNAMPGSQKDRPTTNHEYLFLFAKQQRYFYDGEAIKEPQSEGTFKRYKRGEAIPAKVKWSEDSNKGGSSKTDMQEHIEASQGAMVAILEGGRTRRSVWTIPVASEKDSHFAVFPPRLVEPCIMAGTSEKGECPSCGSPWVRVTETERKPTRPGADTKVTGNGKVDGNRDPQRHVSETLTTGWEPSCKCGGEPVPQTVLDPFGGSGTTAQVARLLGRKYIICELNPEYAKIAEKKIRKNPYESVSKIDSDPNQKQLFD